MASKRKRIGNEKAKAKRARSWNKNQEAKKQRIADQEARHAHNVKVGTTGKQRANAARKLKKALANSAVGNTKDLGDFTQYVEQEDLLEV